MPKLSRWVSISALCVLVVVYFAGFLAFRSVAWEMRQALREMDARVPFLALAASFFLDSWEYALALGGFLLVALGAAVEYLVKTRWIAVAVYLTSTAVFLAALLFGYHAIKGAVAG